MKGICRLELKRAVQNKGTWIVMGLLLLGVFIDYHLYHTFSRDSGKYAYPDIFILGWLPMDYQFVYGSLFRVMFPLAATIPHGTSYYRDRTTGYIKNICVKVPPKKYYQAKYLTAFLTGMVTVVFPLMISLMLAMTYLPVIKPQPFAFQGVVGEAFARIYYSNPLLYAGIYILIDGMYGGLSAAASLCLSDYVKSEFSAAVLPVTLYLLGGALLDQMGFSELSIYSMANPLQDFPVNGWIIGGSIIMGIVLTYYLFCIKNTKHDIC